MSEPHIPATESGHVKFPDGAVYGESPVLRFMRSMIWYEKFLAAALDAANRERWITLPNGAKTTYVGPLELGYLNNAGEFVPIDSIGYAPDTPHIVDS